MDTLGRLQPINGHLFEDSMDTSICPKIFICWVNRMSIISPLVSLLHHENVRWHPRRGAYMSAPPGYILFQHVDLLEHILAPYPAVQIVLSTTWARVYGYSRSAKRLPPALKSRVIGATFHSNMDEANFTAEPRGMQVWNDVLRRKPKDWIALDDDFLDWPAWCLDKYVRTHEMEGISEPSVEAELRQKLALMCAIGESLD